MFKITFYESDGSVKTYEHVPTISHFEEKIIFDEVTDAGYYRQVQLPADRIKTIMMRCMK